MAFTTDIATNEQSYITQCYGWLKIKHSSNCESGMPLPKPLIINKI